MVGKGLRKSLRKTRCIRMTSVEFKTHLKAKNRGYPDNENQWQISGSDYRQTLSDGPRVDATETRFSAWTPITNKACNHQVGGKNNCFKQFY